MATINTLLMRNRTQESYWMMVGIYDLPETKTEKDREKVIASVEAALNVKDTERASKVNAKAIAVRCAVGTTGKPVFSAFWLEKTGEHPEYNMTKTLKEALKLSADDLVKAREASAKRKADAVDALDF